MNDGLTDLSHLDHQRLISFSTGLIYQTSFSIMTSLKAIADKMKNENCRKMKHSTTIIPDNPRSSFGDIMAYSFDFPKLYAHFMGSRDCSHNHTINHEFVENTKSGFSKRFSRFRSPPVNYICRLCHFAGHWIEQCSKFKPNNSFRILTDDACVLCGDPGHHPRLCTKFAPIVDYEISKTRSLTSKIYNTQYLHNQEYLSNIPIFEFVRNS